MSSALPYPPYQTSKQHSNYKPEFTLDAQRCRIYTYLKSTEFQIEGANMKIREDLFAGHECIKIENESLAAWILKSRGPRIIGLALKGRHNLLAELPDARLELPGNKYYSLIGGHRLWYAPEDPTRTYLPDDKPVQIIELEYGVLIIQPVEEETGIQKSITLILPDESPHMVVDHKLTNQGDREIILAPWAITMVKPGGFAILPQPSVPSDPFGLLPNRAVALWTYTDIRSEHILWGNRFIFIRANMQEGALKVGFPNPAGWMGYLLENALFIKYAEYNPEKVYYDRGSSSECYCNPGTLELETLGPRTNLSPAESVFHREEWKVFAGISCEPDEKEIGKWIDKLRIENDI